MGNHHSGESRTADLSSYSSDTHPPLWLQIQHRHTVPNTPPLLFTHPFEANRLERSSGLRTCPPCESSPGTDKQHSDNPIEFSLSSSVLLPACMESKGNTLARTQHILPDKCLRSVVLYGLLCMIVGFLVLMTTLA